MKLQPFSTFLLLLLASCASSETARQNASSPRGTTARTESQPAVAREPGSAAAALPTAPPSDSAGASGLAASTPSSRAEPDENGLGAKANEPTRDEDTPTLRSLPRGTKVLHVGDSFAGALGLPLGRLLEERGIHSILKHTDASYLTDWAWDGQLQKYLWKYNPDLVIVTLGANELGIADPARRIKTIRKITSTIGDRPCLWVGIPLWDGRQNGLMDVIQDHASPCIYWDSNEVLDVAAMPRISDGIHPTSSARESWAAVLVSWLEQHLSGDGDRPWTMQP